MKTPKQKKPKRRNISIYFIVPAKPPCGSSFAEGWYRLRGKDLSRQLLEDRWIESSCPLKEFKKAICEGLVLPEVST